MAIPDSLYRILLCVAGLIVCAGLIWFSASEIKNRLDSETAVDRTGSEIDNRGLRFLQILGFVLLAGIPTLVIVVWMFALLR